MSNRPQNDRDKQQRGNQPPQQGMMKLCRDSMLMGAAHWDRLKEISEAAAKSGLLPAGIKTAQAALIVALKGVEMGFSPMQAFERISVIDGKAVIDGQGMLILIMERLPEAQITWLESTIEKCTVRIKNPKQNEAVTETFTIEDAKRAALLSKSNWQRYPKMMLRWRALVACARIAVPHVIGGCYTRDEMGLETDEMGNGIPTQFNSENIANARDVTQTGNASNLNSSPAALPPGKSTAPDASTEVKNANPEHPAPKSNAEFLEEIFQKGEDKGISRDEIREAIKQRYPEAKTLGPLQLVDVLQIVNAMPAKESPPLELPRPPVVAPEEVSERPDFEPLPFEKRAEIQKNE